MNNKIKDFYEDPRICSLADFIDEFLVVINRGHEVIFINKKGADILGMAANEIKGKNWFDCFVPESNREEVRKVFSTLLDSGIENVEYFENTVLTQKKEERLIRWRNAVLYDESGKAEGAFGTGVDITEIKMQKNEISDQSYMLNDFFNNASDLIQVVDMDSRFIFVNKTWIDVMGYSEDEAKRMTIFDVIHPSMMAHCKQLFEGFKKGIDVTNLNTMFVAKKGREINVEGNINVRMKNGIPLNTRGIFRDVTVKKIIERRLIESFEKLKKLDALKTDFASMITHELRTPLVSVKALTSFMLKGAVGEINPKQKEYLENIKSNVDRQILIINELLDVSKMESEGFEIEKKQVDIYDLAEKAVASIKALADDKQINLNVIRPDFECVTDADYDRLLQVFINLLANSLKFSPVSTEISIKFKSVDNGMAALPNVSILSPIASGKYIQIVISDQGVGIRKQDLDKIFDRFTQAGDDKQKKKGTGLGLNISKLIVEAHKGRIWAESEGENKGAVFNIILPA